MTNTPLTTDEQSKILRDWEASGLSAGMFIKAGNHNFTQASLYRWRWEAKKRKTHQSRSEAGPDNRRKRYSVVERKELVRLFRDSGMSKEAFIKQHQPLSVDSLRRWTERYGRSIERAEQPAAVEARPAVRVAQHTNGQAGGNLHCPCCGCDLLAEFAKLTAKLRAMASIQF